VPFDPSERRRLGATRVEVTRLGLGGAPLGGLYTAVDDDEAAATIRHAWDIGVRYFDTAPLYGYGSAERRMGRVLREHARDEFTLSTKVGRVIIPDTDIQTGADVDRQEHDGRENAFYVGTDRVRPVFDYSSDGVVRSIEESLERLGLDRIDIALIHDPDDHWEAAIDGAYPALARLREAGVVGAIGAGMNQSAMLARFAREGDFDVFMVAGRYTLLDQEALADLLPLCRERGISVIVGGVMNSGILADPKPGSRFNYVPAEAHLVERAQRLASVCARYGVPLKAAAIQFPLAHPTVESIVAGVRRIDHLDEYPALFRLPIPGDLWDELRAERLLPAEAPTPVEAVA
jgi:D-threo-aldose 1-dehydrogenase